MKRKHRNKRKIILKADWQSPLFFVLFLVKGGYHSAPQLQGYWGRKAGREKSSLITSQSFSLWVETKKKEKKRKKKGIFPRKDLWDLIYCCSLVSFNKSDQIIIIVIVIIKSKNLRVKGIWARQRETPRKSWKAQREICSANTMTESRKKGKQARTISKNCEFRWKKSKKENKTRMKREMNLGDIVKVHPLALSC